MEPQLVLKNDNINRRSELGTETKAGADRRARRVSGTSERSNASPQQQLSTDMESIDAPFPLLPVVFVLALCLPFYFYIGSVRMTPYRIILVASILPLIFSWLTGKAGRPSLIDLGFLGAALFGSLSLIIYMANTHDEAVSAQTIVVYFVETIGPYLLGRVCIGSYGQFFKFSKFLFILLLVLLPFGLAETFLHQKLLLKVLAPILTVYGASDMELRYGLTRAQVIFEHPILWGVFSSSFFGIVIYTLGHRLSIIGKTALGIPLVTATFTSISAGGLMSIALQFMLMVWDKITARMNRRWFALACLGAAIYTVVALITNRTPFHVLVSYLTFSAGSSYMRLIIWQYASADVWANPIFGIGLGEWDRPSFVPMSVDNFWLLTALRYGLPTLFFLAFSILLLMTRMGKAEITSPAASQARSGLLIVYVGIIMSGGTVHYWNAIYCWVMFLFGAGYWATAYTRTAAKASSSTGDLPISETASSEPRAEPAAAKLRNRRHENATNSKPGMAPTTRKWLP